MVTANRYNEEDKLEEIMRLIKAGLKVTLVCDAGSPCLSDPGYKIVNEAIKRNIMIHSLPGPNALTISLMSSGFPADSFNFGGFLPKKKIEKFLENFKNSEKTAIFFENKNRLMASLFNIEKVYGKK